LRERDEGKKKEERRVAIGRAEPVVRVVFLKKIYIRSYVAMALMIDQMVASFINTLSSLFDDRSGRINGAMLKRAGEWCHC